MEERSAFGWPWMTYLEILLVACGAGAIKYLNAVNKAEEKVKVVTAVFKGLLAILTAGFSGVMTFWIIQWWQPELNLGLTFFMVGVSGLMGTTTWKYFEAVFISVWAKRVELMMLLMAASANPAPGATTKGKGASDEEPEIAHGAVLEPKPRGDSND